MSFPGLPRKTRLNTYSHLGGALRLPTEYEIATSRLHWYTSQGFAVQTPVCDWYERHQRRSPLRLPDWERFEDPRHTTYGSYTLLQSRQEIYVDGLFQSIEERRYDFQLSPAAVQLAERLLVPLRYPLHGLQLCAAYLGQMAPSGRITVAAAFQAGDEMRRVQRISQRTALLRRAHPSLGNSAARAWQEDAQWQPLRRLIEELLVTWDWGECLAALNLCVKPLFDELFLVALPRAAQAAGDELCGEIMGSLAADGRWHHEWASSLARLAEQDRDENRVVLRGWTEAWTARATAAFQPFIDELGTEAAPELLARWVAA